MGNMAHIGKLPSGRWLAKIRKKGHKSVSKTFRTRARAVAWANRIEDEIEHGVAGNTSVADLWTVSQLLDKYEREITSRKKGASKETSKIKILSASLGDYTVHELSTGTIIGYADKRLQAVGSDTVRRELAVLSSVIEAGRILWGLSVRENPVHLATEILTNTKTYKPKIVRSRRLRDGELDRLLQPLSPLMRRVVSFAIETAMRRSEICRVHPGDINGNTLLITDDKTSKTTIIPLSKRALSLIGDGFPIRPDSVTQAFDRACRKAGIEDLRFHDLRHEATSRFFEKGLTIEEVAAITRHSDWRSLKRYTHPKPESIAIKLR